MIHLGLLGWPVSHSLSPKLHHAALRAVGLEGEYSLFPVKPGNDEALVNLMTSVRDGQLNGLNVTIPYKQVVIPLLDRLTLSAAAIGAVNTLYIENGLLIGHNTDAPGFLEDLKKFTGEVINSRTGSALVLGAGGSARAVVFGLISSFNKVMVAARNVEQAQNLVSSFRNIDRDVVIEAVELNPSAWGSRLNETKLIVNATPVGMFPKVEFSPWPVGSDFPESAVVYDLIYNPPETYLVRMARERGLRATTGLGMLVEQAALGFEIWTGCNPPRDLMRFSLEG